MEIIYQDGSVLTCNEIEISGNYIIADGIYQISIEDISRIIPV